MRLAPLVLRAAASAIFVVWGVPTAEPTWAEPALAAGPGERVVTYAGVSVRVPAAWPVYDLAAAPQTCVRYDVSAVYLGQPGPDQECPAHAMGRADTLAIEPEAVPRDRPLDEEDPQTEMTVSRQVGGARLTASYADDDGAVSAILASARPARGVRHGSAKASPASVSTTPSMATAMGPAMAQAPVPDVSTAAFDTGSAPADTAEVQPAAYSLPLPRIRAETRDLKPVMTYTGKGFDTCAAPSVATMSAWKTASPFRAAGIYIGGSDRACPDGNLTPSWVRQVGAMGWRMFPIYVGRQASCWQDPGGSKSKAPRIQHSSRWTQGVQAADDAASRAAYFGLVQGSAIYFDMEYYPRANTQCAQDVQAFLNAWTDELHKRGFLSAVYSSARGAVADMAQIYDSQSAYRTDAVWFAHWDNKAGTTGDPTLSDKLWPGHRRIKQYVGGHDATYGGKKLNIDSDVLDAPVAATAPAPKKSSDTTSRARPGLTRPVPKNQSSSTR